MKKFYVVILLSFLMTILCIYATDDFSKFFAWILLLICFQYAQKEETWFSPFSLFLITILSFILYIPSLGGIYMDKLEFESVSFAILSMCAVVLGFIVMKKKRKKPLNIGNKSGSFFLIFFIGILPTYVSYMMFGNIVSLEGEDLLEAKEQFTLPILGQLSYFLPASIVVACKKDKTKYILIAIIFSIISALLTISKTALLLTVVFFLIAVSKFTPSITDNYIYKRFNTYKFIFIPILILFMFVYNNNKRQSATNRDMEFVESSSVNSVWGKDNFSQNMFLNYCYFVQPWSNFNYNVLYNKENGKIGGNTLSQFAKKIGVKPQKIRKKNPYFFNTHTYLTDYYLDFGFVFGCFMSFLLGMFIYYCYSRFGNSDDPLLISFYILVAYATIMMFFSNHFNIGYLLNYFMTFGFTSFLIRKNIIK